jgi:hypothetical protein
MFRPYPPPTADSGADCLLCHGGYRWSALLTAGTFVT